MKEPWTGELVGKMHMHSITNEDLAKEIGVCKSYVSMVLNGKKHPKGMEQRMVAAFDHILLSRREAAQ